MPERQNAPTSYHLVCPHCRKEFEAELLRGGASRYQGFKCPHCRLFVSYARVEEQVDGTPRA